MMIWIITVLPPLIWGFIYVPLDPPKIASERIRRFMPLAAQYGVTFLLTASAILMANIIVFRFLSRHATVVAANLGAMQAFKGLRHSMTTAMLQFMSTCILQVSF